MSSSEWMVVLPWVLTGAWFVLTEITFVNLLLADRLERMDGDAPGVKSLSILIPARNEASNLAVVLPMWKRAVEELRRRHPAVAAELLLLDDQSEDGTGDLARKALREFPLKARVISGGGEPPRGWVGKNWACHRLAKEASGQWLLFADADVRPGPQSLCRTLSASARLGVDAVTALPRQELESVAERAVVPWIMHVSILSLLPLPLVRRISSPSISVLNGQWFFVRRTALDRAGGHEAVRGSVLEDVELGRRLKSSGAIVAPVIASRDVSVRMYRSGRELMEGYGKNLFLLAGGSWGTVLVLCAAVVFVFWGPFLFRSFPLIVLSVTVLGLQLKTFRASVLNIAPMILSGVPSLIALSLESTWRHLSGKVTWKGRRIGGGVD